MESNINFNKFAQNLINSLYNDYLGDKTELDSIVDKNFNCSTNEELESKADTDKFACYVAAKYYANCAKITRNVDDYKKANDYYLKGFENDYYPSVLGYLGYTYTDSIIDDNKCWDFYHDKLLPLTEKSAHANFYMGDLYVSFDTPFYNADKAKHYWDIASKNGCKDAFYQYGLFYFQGWFPEGQDIPKAIEYYKAADSAYGYYNVAMLYNELEDNENSVKYMKLSASMGFSDAQYYAADSYLYGSEVDIDKGIEYLTNAANDYVNGALYELGALYADGIFVEKDIDKAIHYLEIAAFEDEESNDHYICEASDKLVEIYSSKERYDPELVEYYKNLSEKTENWKLLA